MSEETVRVFLNDITSSVAFEPGLEPEPHEPHENSFEIPIELYRRYWAARQELETSSDAIYLAYRADWEARKATY